MVEENAIGKTLKQNAIGLADSALDVLVEHKGGLVHIRGVRGQLDERRAMPQLGPFRGGGARREDAHCVVI